MASTPGLQPPRLTPLLVYRWTRDLHAHNSRQSRFTYASKLLAEPRPFQPVGKFRSRWSCLWFTLQHTNVSGYSSNATKTRIFENRVRGNCTRTNVDLILFRIIYSFYGFHMGILTSELFLAIDTVLLSKFREIF